MHEPPQLAPFYAKVQRLYSESLSDDQASHPIPKGDAYHPPEKTYFGRLYLWYRSFGHDPPFMTIGEGRNEDWPVDWELCLLAQLSLHHNGVAKRMQNRFSGPSHVPLYPHSRTRSQDTWTPSLGVVTNFLLLHPREQKCFPYMDFLIKAPFFYGQNEGLFHITVSVTVCDLKWRLIFRCFYPDSFLL